ncbi:cold-shock protein [Pedobacter punctiformis]|uniref:Cold shock domain-containing protein n=1 Tax=Pedobacter punctiformis TaxID=3004097 RepID=A0ABT4L6K7_9SPHI|nr:cold shock domain-containing protein [Pedobacter sp. HCMS5-2]MCZ4243555.1 cold shock domain-containing protein [Pedobacter sp. HCMS5-2]
MPKGIIKWYNPNRGFGFISSENGSEAIFADCEKIIHGDPKELKEGIKVDYQILSGKTGKQAINIKILSSN